MSLPEGSAGDIFGFLIRVGDVVANECFLPSQVAAWHKVGICLAFKKKTSYTNTAGSLYVTP